MKLGHKYPRNTKKINCRMDKKSAKLQAAHRNRGIHEVLADDKDYFQVIVDALLKLEGCTALAMPCIVREDCRRNLRHVQLLPMPVRSSHIQKIQRHAEK